MENITKPAVPPPPPPKGNSNKILIAVIIVIGIIIAVLAIDYFMSTPKEPEGKKPSDIVTETPLITEPPATTNKNPDIEPADTVKQIDEIKKENAVVQKDEPVKPIQKGPSPAQLNALLSRIAMSDDNATDKIRKVLGNSLKVEGAANISNVQELITDVSKGSRYKVTKVNTDATGKVISISVSK